ncbi:MAG TPA: deoxyribose-phosphate aldolase [Polyangiaceae bacterium]|nr:deoxyribose-phosphate aldolase [Polyangiaceae bacterium]
MIDHSLLSPALTAAELEAGCRLAVEYDVASVCLLPYFVTRAAELLAGTDVLPTTTIGFPHGAVPTRVKLAEAESALRDGARELDAVVNVSQVRSGAFAEVRAEIVALTEFVHGRGRKLKLIFENCYLDEPQKLRLCELAGAAGVDWVKTSTGFGSSGATVEDVRLMRAHSPAHVQVKASGGVKELELLLALREAGATRCGSSATRAILDAFKARLAAGLPA